MIYPSNHKEYKLQILPASGASHHISQTMYTDGNFLAHMAGACCDYVQQCVNKAMTVSGVNGLQMAKDQ